MAIALLAILFIGLLLIATESITHINKAAVAMFAGVSSWLIYISYGSDFVMAGHPLDFLSFLSVHPLTATSVKEFISEQIFLKYVLQAADIVLFLLATTTIAEVLNQNGCFDFIGEWIRTRRPRKLMWVLAGLTFLLSANLDNLATVVLMLSIMHPLLQNDKQRRIYGTVIVLSANCGGAITAIGDITSLKLWTDGLVTPSEYFLALLLPIFCAFVVTLLLLQNNLPRRVELAYTALPYRGDDTVLNRSQRLLMLFVGIGGLWFIPTFHRITLMPPFVGALCVLALLWFVNELCNRQLVSSDQMILRRLPMALQYANLQNLLYFIGLVFMFGALSETGLASAWASQIGTYAQTYLPVFGCISAFCSALIGNLPTLTAMTNLCGGVDTVGQGSAFACNSPFWYMLSFSSAVGGTMLSTGTVAGLLLMRMENVGFGWYLRHITPKVAAGLVVGLSALSLIYYFYF